jgi:hypothetical protein
LIWTVSHGLTQWKSNTHNLSISSRVWMVLSNWLSVCGWYVVLKFNLWYNLFQNFDMNRESRSDTMETRTSYGLIVSRVYISASLSIEFVILMGRKWVLFVSLSTMTHMTSCLLATLGRATTKSIAIWSYFHISTSRGWSCPAGLWCLAFTSWRKGHCATYLATLRFMSYQQNFFFRSWYILLLLGWTIYLVTGGFLPLVIFLLEPKPEKYFQGNH